MKVVYASLRKHRVVLDLALAQGRAVVRNEDKFRLALTESLERRLVTQVILAALHDELEPRIDGISVLRCLRLLLRRHFEKTCDCRGRSVSLVALA